MRGKTRDGVVSFTPPCYYHYRVRTCERAATPVRASERPGLRFARRRGLARTLPRRRTAAHARIETAPLRGLRSTPRPAHALPRLAPHIRTRHCECMREVHVSGHHPDKDSRMMPASTNFTSQADAEREECSGAWEFVAALAARSSGEQDRSKG